MPIITNKISNTLSICLLLISTIVLEALLFGDIFFHPNKFCFMLNPDGTQIYFNYMWQLKYGNGVLLTNQNYPFYELIFMTDAQASISMIMSFINQHLFNIEPYSIGIFNIIILLGFPICTYYLFKIFRHFNVDIIFSIFFALIICFLSPQIVRITEGHYGLGYLFYFPALIYFMLRLTDKSSSIIRYGSGILFLVIFFGLNNGHMSLAGGMQVLSFGFFWWLLNKHQVGLRKYIPLLLSLLSLGIIFSIIHGLDFVKDREALPWGFLNFASHFESIFIPTHGWIFDTINKHIEVAVFSEEGVAYIGIFGLIVILFSLYRWLFRPTKLKIKRFFFPLLNKQLNTLLIASICILLFAMAFPFRFGLESVLNAIPFLRQFRAPGRFSWIFYYSFSIYALYFTYIIYRRIHFNFKWIGYTLMAIIGLLYYQDIKEQNAFNFRYLDGHNYPKNPYHPHADSVIKFAHQFEIDTIHYQAIFGLPICNAWNSKYGPESDPSQLVSQMARVSVASGLPWLNAKLSRISTSSVVLSAQLVSHPIITREIFSKLKSNKPILIIHPTNYSLTSYDSNLISNSKIINKDSNYTYYSFSPNTFNYSLRDSIINNFKSILITQFDSAQFLKNQNLFITKFFKDEVETYSNQDRIIFETSFINADTNMKMHFSIWTKLDYKTDGSPWLEYTQIDTTGNWVEDKWIWSAHVSDYQHGYLRIDLPFEIKSPKNKFVFKLKPGNGHIFERMMIRPIDFDICDTTNHIRSFNNYLIEK